MHCGDQYPDKPPTIQFVSMVNLPCVNQRNGLVDPSQLPCLANWKRENTMETILIELRRCVCLPPTRRSSMLTVLLMLTTPGLVAPRRYMASSQCKKLPQPPEGTVYPGN